MTPPPPLAVRPGKKRRTELSCPALYLFRRRDERPIRREERRRQTSGRRKGEEASIFQDQDKLKEGKKCAAIKGARSGEAELASGV